MKPAALMQGHTPDPSYEGFSTADDFVLAVDFTGKAANPDDYVVAQEGISEHSAALNPQTQETQYVRGGAQTNKTGNQRAFKLSGDRYIGDEFQDALMSHAIKYGKGPDVVKPYVYFNLLTGVGEQGDLCIQVEDDPAGAAGENAGISATLSARGVPAEYTYAPAVAPTAKSAPVQK